MKNWNSILRGSKHLDKLNKLDKLDFLFGIGSVLDLACLSGSVVSTESDELDCSANLDKSARSV